MALQPTIVALLAAVVVVLVWVGIELYRLRSGLQPLLDSSIARGLSSF